MKLLIDFDVIINTDISVCDIIKKKYSKILKNKNINVTKQMIVDRYNPNPLEIISIDTITEENLDNIYFELMDKEFENIVKGSFTTDIMEYIKIIKDIENVSVTIRCKSKKEYDYINSLSNYSSFDKIHSENLNNDYDMYIIKVYDYKVISILEGKKIYIPNYNFNKLFIIYGNALYNKNDVMIIDIFDNNLKLKG